MIQLQLFITTIFLIFATCSYGGEQIYNCRIKKVYDLDDIGNLKTSYWQDDLVGGEFVVARKTGQIQGETLTTLLAKQTIVVNYGSKENSFKSCALFEGQIQIIEIQEFKEDKEKPFVASSMGGAGIVTGICR